MDDVACDAGAIAETVVFLGHFKDLPMVGTARRSVIRWMRCYCVLWR